MRVRGLGATLRCMEAVSLNLEGNSQMSMEAMGSLGERAGSVRVDAGLGTTVTGDGGGVESEWLINPFGLTRPVPWTKPQPPFVGWSHPLGGAL
jgi:hypothetical protein